MNQTEPYVMIPKKAFKIGLSPVQFMILAFITSHNLAKFSPTMKLISTELGISKNAVRLAIKALKEKGIISYSKKPLNGTFINQYVIKEY